VTSSWFLFFRETVCSIQGIVTNCQHIRENWGQPAIVGAALNYHTFCRLTKIFVIKNVITPKRQKSVSIVENMPKMNIKSCLSIQSGNMFLVQHLNHQLNHLKPSSCFI